MPRDPAGTYTYPPGIEGIPDQTIESADYNSFLLDVQADLNYPRPIVSGGTGARNAQDAITNLSGETADQDVDNYDSFPFVPGSFHSDNATGHHAPIDGHAFAGICYIKDADITIEARDLNGTATTIGIKYIRQKIAGTWGPWRQDGIVMIASDTPPVGAADNTLWLDLDSASMFILFNDGDSTQWVQWGKL